MSKEVSSALGRLDGRPEILFNILDYIAYLRTKWNTIKNFKLKPNRKETKNKAIKFPVPLIEKMVGAITKSDPTFPSFVIQVCEFSLENMKKKNSRMIGNMRV